MTEHTAHKTLPPVPGLIAGALVVIGVLLWMFVSKGLLFIAGLGAFGLGILRELGWLRDQDEFQRQAARRAGYHAYLIGGLVTVSIISALEWTGTDLEITTEWIRLILVVLWLSWLFSSLLAYWGAQTTTKRVLLTFGSFWAVFVLAHFVGDVDLTGNPGETLLGMLAGIMIVAPFFVLAYTADRWPRLTGAILLAVSAGFAVVFGPSGALSAATELLTGTLLIVPLFASGIALLRQGRSAETDDEEPDEDDVAG